MNKVIGIKNAQRKKKVKANVKEMEINEVIAYAFLTNILKDKKRLCHEPYNKSMVVF